MKILYGTIVKKTLIVCIGLVLIKTILLGLFFGVVALTRPTAFKEASNSLKVGYQHFVAPSVGYDAFAAPNLRVGIVQRNSDDLPQSCDANTSSSSCGTHGTCGADGLCICDSSYITHTDGQPCAYELRSKKIAFILSFIVGSYGVDWFYLCRDNGGYIVAGVFKLILLGACGIWWLIDWIRVLTDTFDDGHDVNLESDNPTIRNLKKKSVSIVYKSRLE